MLTILFTTLLALAPAAAPAEQTNATVLVWASQSMQQPQPRRSDRPADQSKPLPDTTQKKGKPKQPASVDSLRRGGATRVDTVRA